MSLLDTLRRLLTDDGIVGAEGVSSYLSAAKREVAAVAAAAKRAKAEAAKLRRDAAQWRQKAETAVKLGRDDLARQALRRAFRLESDAAELEAEAAEHEGYVRELTGTLKALQGRARIPGRKGVVVDGRPFREFERMADAVEVEAAEADLEGEVGAGDAVSDLALANKIAELEASQRADEELEKLKANVRTEPGARGRSSAHGARRAGAARRQPEAGDLDEDLRAELEAIRRQLGGSEDEDQD